MPLRCSSFRKNLSAFLDDELGERKRRQLELHISECEDCRKETEKLREMISLISGTERPKTPPQLWEETRRRLETASERSTRTLAFKIPRWGAIPAAAVVFTLLFYLLGGQLFFSKHEAGPTPITVYLQEHTLSYSHQTLPSDLLRELEVVQTEQATEETQSDEPMSELEMLMEVHYGTYQTNGS